MLPPRSQLRRSASFSFILSAIGKAILQIALRCSVLPQKGTFIAYMAVVCSECAPRGMPIPLVGVVCSEHDVWGV